jgi:predicted nucleotidyltransferase
MNLRSNHPEATREYAETPLVESQIALSDDAIAELSDHYGIEQLAVFGSVLRSDFRPDSDIDFLVTFIDDDEGPWMSKLQALESALAEVLGRDVDVVSRRGIEQSQNALRREGILESAVTIYER